MKTNTAKNIKKTVSIQYDFLNVELPSYTKNWAELLVLRAMTYKIVTLSKKDVAIPSL